ncbi:MAG: glycosyltransferase family 4 protein [Phycisphaerae bacterium]|nr:glycosyltransferase family 4 protein [Phycisphaerae bacterium]
MHVMKMCQAFAKHGHKVTLLAYGSKRGSTEDVYRYYGVDETFVVKQIPVVRTRGGTLLSLPRLCRELRKYSPSATLVYARSIYGASLAVRMGFRIVYEAHAAPAHALIRWLEKRLFRAEGFRKLIVISDSLRRIYLDLYGPIRHVEVCHDAADIPRTEDTPECTWPCRMDRLQIGYAGHLYRGRGIDLILGCAGRLASYDFHIVGGMERDIQYWRERAGSNVHFHGFVQPSLVPAVLSRCDVLLLPYQKGLSLGGRNIDSSGWMSPMKLFEYMAARRAIIASDLPVLREVLNEGNSILVRPDDIDGWTAAIRACEDPQCRDRLAVTAYKEFLANYTWEKRAAGVLQGVPL